MVDTRWQFMSSQTHTDTWNMVQSRFGTYEVPILLSFMMPQGQGCLYTMDGLPTTYLLDLTQQWQISTMLEEPHRLQLHILACLIFFSFCLPYWLWSTATKADFSGPDLECLIGFQFSEYGWIMVAVMWKNFKAIDRHKPTLHSF